MKHDLRRKDERSYFYNIKTTRIEQIEDDQYEARYITYPTVQRARKNLASRLWIDKDTEFKITKKNDKYVVESDRFFYSPFADRKFFIKTLEVEFRNIVTNPNNIYKDVKIITGDEYNDVLNKKLLRLSDDIVNGPKRFYAAQVERLKKLDIGEKKTRLDGNFNYLFAVLRQDENTFEIFRAYNNSNLVISISTEGEEGFTYEELSNCTANVRKVNVKEAINMAIEFIEEDI